MKETMKKAKGKLTGSEVTILLIFVLWLHRKLIANGQRTVSNAVLIESHVVSIGFLLYFYYRKANLGYSMVLILLYLIFRGLA